MKKRLFAALFCVMMLLTLLPVTAMAATATTTTRRSRAYTINESQMDTVFMNTVFFAGDVITFTPTAPAWSPGNYVCTPFSGIAFKNAYAGIAEINEQYKGAISKITITSPSPVTFYYRGAGPTGMSTGEGNAESPKVAYRMWYYDCITHASSWPLAVEVSQTGVEYYGVDGVSISAGTLTLDPDYSGYSVTVTGRPYREQYHFGGWAPAGGNSAEIINMPLSAVPSGNTATVNLDLSYSQHSYPAQTIKIVPLWSNGKTLTLEGNGGTVDGYESKIFEITNEEGQVISLGGHTVSQEGKRFVGWATRPQNTTTFEEFTTEDSRVYRFFALWEDAPANMVATPTFNPVAGTYTSAQSVTLSCATAGATIRYTTNGNDPTEASTAFVAGTPIAVSSTTTIKAKAFKNGMTASKIASATYTINTQPPAPSTVATPTFSPAGGTFTSAQSVTLSCSTAGATIRYTTNGNDPTEASTVFVAGTPISVSSTTTIKAKAFKAGMTASEIASATYTINTQPPTPSTVATPTFSPAGGTFTSAQSVTLSCSTAGATIRYTTNGNDPTETSTAFVVGTPISVSSTTTIKAKAFKNGMTASGVVSATYTITTTITTAPGPDPDPDTTAYPVVEGDQGEWTEGSANGLTIRVNGDYSKFQSVAINGNTIGTDEYISASGSTIITLKAAYLETLDAGQYTLRVSFTDGYAQTHFTVASNALDDVPQSDDGSNPSLWVIMSILGGMGLIGAVIFITKKKRAQ